MSDESPHYVPPSIHKQALLSGASFTHFSPVPPSLLPSDSSPTGTPCALGVDEAGRGPVLGPMVYGIFYLPLPLERPLLTESHRFDDSKVLTPAFRTQLMKSICTEDTDLFKSCGWATAALSARDIGANMMKPAGVYNLNAQAMDATIMLIRGVFERGVNVQEIYVDTIGQPAAYQAKLERVFPGIKITVAKKADSLYPCVSAASICAKVTRDSAMEVLWEGTHKVVREKKEGEEEEEAEEEEEGMGWGSGYPSDGRCTGWLKGNMHPLFGWGPECRFSWGTAKDLVEGKGGKGVKVEWPEPEEEDMARMTDFFLAKRGHDEEEEVNELGSWYGRSAGLEAF